MMPRPYSRSIPTVDGVVRVTAGRDAVTLAIYGRRGGLAGGVALELGLAPALAAALTEAEARVLDSITLDEVDDVDSAELSAVPWLGTH
jgi:hypothetical protein